MKLTTVLTDRPREDEMSESIIGCKLILILWYSRSWKIMGPIYYYINNNRIIDSFLYTVKQQATKCKSTHYTVHQYRSPKSQGNSLSKCKLHSNVLYYINRTIMVTRDYSEQLTTYWASSVVDSMYTPSTKPSKDSAALCFAFFFDIPATNTHRY